MVSGYKSTCGHVEIEILVSPSLKRVTVRLEKSIPKHGGIARLHSYQKPVDTEMQEFLPRSSMALRVATAGTNQSSTIVSLDVFIISSLTLWLKNRNIFITSSSRFFVTIYSLTRYG
jgi:hypothetical protein